MKIDLDQMIREALSKEDQELFDQLGEPSIFEMVTSSFRGTLRWLMFFAITFGILLMALGVYSLVQFLRAGDDVPEMIRWGALLFFSLGSVTAMKIWHWMEMQRHMLTREIKRLELQLANVMHARDEG